MIQSRVFATTVACLLSTTTSFSRAAFVGTTTATSRTIIIPGVAAATTFFPKNQRIGRSHTFGSSSTTATTTTKMAATSSSSIDKEEVTKWVNEMYSEFCSCTNAHTKENVGGQRLCGKIFLPMEV